MISISQTSSPRWQAWAKVVILFGLAVYFAVIILTGGLANYINSRFAWLSVAAVPMLALLGGVSLRDAMQKPRPYNVLSGNASSVVSWSALLTLAVPLMLGVLIPSRPLGATAVNGDISLSAINTANASIFEADPLKWNVLDWLRAFHTSADISTFNGKPADVVAFVYREASYPADTFLAARFTISCCVADASAIGLPVVWKDASAIRQDTWVHVHGTFQIGDFGADSVPMLIAESVEEVPQPEHPYLYP